MDRRPTRAFIGERVCESGRGAVAMRAAERAAWRVRRGQWARLGLQARGGVRRVCTACVRHQPAWQVAEAVHCQECAGASAGGRIQACCGTAEEQVHIAEGTVAEEDHAPGPQRGEGVRVGQGGQRDQRN